MPSGVNTLRWEKKSTTATYQSNPAAKEASIAGAMSLAAVMIYFSARTFLCAEDRKRKG